MSSDASKLHVFLLGHFEKKENKLCGENVNIDNPKFLRHQIFQNCSSCPLAFFSFQGQRWRFQWIWWSTWFWPTVPIVRLWSLNTILTKLSWNIIRLQSFSKIFSVSHRTWVKIDMTTEGYFNLFSSFQLDTYSVNAYHH